MKALALLWLCLPAWGASISGPLTLFVTPGKAGHKPVIEAIDGARTSVRMVMYHLTDPKVALSLIEAKSRGADVRVILDGSSLGGKKYASVYRKLQAAGVGVRKATPGFSITHQKSLVVDGEKAFILSMNLTKGYNKTRDYGLVAMDTNIIGEMIAVFEADWQNAQRQTAYTPPLSLPFLVWSPADSERKLVRFVDSASRALDATVENLGDREMQAAFLRAAGRGVRVRLITPMCDLNTNPVWNYPFMRELRAGGVETRVMPYPSTAKHPYMHAKMMLADGARAYIGSINFSVNSMTKARELGILFSDETAGKGLSAIFASDWDASVPAPEPPPAFCPLPD